MGRRFSRVLASGVVESGRIICRSERLHLGSGTDPFPTIERLVSRKKMNITDARTPHKIRRNQNIARQWGYWDSSPPTSGPRAGPSV